MVCAYIGVIIKRRYQSRERFYSDAAEFTSAVSTQLGFKKTPLPEVFSSFSAGRKGEFVDMLGEYMTAMSQKGEFVRDSEKWEVAHLKIEEKKEMIKFLSSLGKTSLSEQLSLLATSGKEFENKKAKCAEESKRLGGMYFKLLVLLGLAVLLIVA